MTRYRISLTNAEGKPLSFVEVVTDKVSQRDIILLAFEPSIFEMGLKIFVEPQLDTAEEWLAWQKRQPPGITRGNRHYTWTEMLRKGYEDMLPLPKPANDNEPLPSKPDTA